MKKKWNNSTVTLDGYNNVSEILPGVESPLRHQEYMTSNGNNRTKFQLLFELEGASKILDGSYINTNRCDGYALKSTEVDEEEDDFINEK